MTLRRLPPPISIAEFAQWMQNCLEPVISRAAAVASSVHSCIHPPIDHNGILQSRNVGIAVSGGMDSMALVTLLDQYYKEQSAKKDIAQTEIHAFIVNHNLRPESTEEANHVASLVQRIGPTPHVLHLDWKAIAEKNSTNVNSVNNDSNINGNSNSNRYGNYFPQSPVPTRTHLETRARIERYRILSRTCQRLNIEQLFVGHHGGDQVETVVFRLARASGIEGLSGIREVSPLAVVDHAAAKKLAIIRPLLKATKPRLEATCRQAGVGWVEDPSNKSLDYQRNVIRQHQHRLDVHLANDKYDTLQQPLSSESWLTFRDRMESLQHAAWTQVAPWLSDVKWDKVNGLCYIRLYEQSTMTGAQSAPVRFLKESHVANRLLAHLVSWVSCKDHTPRLDDIQQLVWQLSNPSRCQTKRSVKAISTSKTDLKNSSGSERPSSPRMRSSKVIADDAILRHHSQINVAGTVFIPPSRPSQEGFWTIARQPFTRSESNRLSIKLTPPTARNSTEIFWDGRFFLKLERSLQSDMDFLHDSNITDTNGDKAPFKSPKGHPQAQILRIRPMTNHDVKNIRRQSLNLLHEWRQQQQQQVQWQENEQGDQELTRRCCPKQLSLPHQQQQGKEQQLGAGQVDLLLQQNDQLFLQDSKVDFTSAKVGAADAILKFLDSVSAQVRSTLPVVVLTVAGIKNVRDLENGGGCGGVDEGGQEVLVALPTLGLTVLQGCTLKVSSNFKSAE